MYFFAFLFTRHGVHDRVWWKDYLMLNIVECQKSGKDNDIWLHGTENNLYSGVVYLYKANK
jgi:hypothetical protein